jgi:hypothetical protein
MAFFGNPKHFLKKENVVTSHVYILTNTQKNKTLQSKMCTSYNEYKYHSISKGYKHITVIKDCWNKSYFLKLHVFELPPKL